MKAEILERLTEIYGNFEIEEDSFKTKVVRSKSNSEQPYKDPDFQQGDCILTQKETDSRPTGLFPILDNEQEISIGDIVEIQPMISRLPNGGSITIYDINKVSA